MSTLRVAMVGMGNTAQALLELLVERGPSLQAQAGLQVEVVLAADSQGVLVAPQGIAISDLIARKRAGGLGAGPRPELARALHDSGATVMVETTITNLDHGQPGLDHVLAALDAGVNVITCNKGPLVIAYDELAQRARARGARLGFGAAVAAGLPSVNLARSELTSSRVTGFEAILNTTTGHILAEMAQRGVDFDVALAAAQAMKIAERDPRLDVEGWDTAAKTVILANAVLGGGARLAEAQVQGITGLTAADLSAAQAKGQAVRLVGSAHRHADGVELRVGPRALAVDHPLAGVEGRRKGVVFYTELLGAITVTSATGGLRATAASMLQDLVNLVLPG